jgi:Glycosyl transferase family 2.
VAINYGLKLITGDYLVWPDSDDWYAADDAIQQMASVLESSDDSVSMVRCQSYRLDEITLKQVGKFCVSEATKGKTDLFTDCLFGLNGFYYGAGNYMAKTGMIDEYIPNKDIYTSKNAGQNWQLMLPLLYNHKCLTIEKFLYNILERELSHSRGQYSTFEQQLQKTGAYENTLLTTIDHLVNMPIVEKQKYQQVIQNKYKKIRFGIGLRFRNLKTIRENYSTGALVGFGINFLKRIFSVIKRIILGNK